jgi:hypothetical protein
VRVKAALALGLSVIAVAVALTLARAPLVLTSENSPLTHTEPAAPCQSQETLPSHTSVVRLGLTTTLGPRVNVRVFSAGHLIASGVHPPGWEGASVAVPVKPLPEPVAPVKVCVQLSQLNGPVGMFGFPTHPAIAAADDGETLPGRMHVEYLQAGRQSWWSMASAVATRLGLGRTASGSWNALLVMALATVLVALSSWLLVRELR